MTSRDIGASSQADWTFSVSHMSVVTDHVERLSDVSFTLRPGQMLAVVGGSGAGKSTLIRAISGTDRPSAGQVHLRGTDVFDRTEDVRRRIGYVAQEDSFHGGLTAGSTLQFAAMLRLREVSEAERDQRVLDVAGELGLTHRLSARVRELSGGQRKRLSVAVELLSRPEVLILDEPTSGLDPANERSLMTTLRQLSDGGRVVITVTHSTESLHLCDSLLFLARGGVPVYLGPPERVTDALRVNSMLDAFTFVMTHPTPENIRVKHVDDPTSLPPPGVPKAAPVRPSTWSPDSWASSAPRVGHDVWVFLQRGLAVLLSDTKTSRVLAAQGLALGLLILAVFGGGRFDRLGDGSDPAGLLLALVLGVVFIGTASTVREIVIERQLVQREFAVGASPFGYLVSKIVLFGTIVLGQAVVMTAVVVSVQNPDRRGALGLDPIIEIVTVLAVAGLASVMLGLALSASAHSPEKALVMLPFALFSQLLLAGVIVPMTGIITRPISWLAISRWGLDGAGSAVDLWTLRGCDYGTTSRCASTWSLSAVHFAIAYVAILVIGMVLFRVALRYLTAAPPVQHAPSIPPAVVRPAAQAPVSNSVVRSSFLQQSVAPSRRVASWSIDVAVGVMLLVVSSRLTDGVLSLLFLLVLFGAYFVALPATGFDTLGHVALGIRVVRGESAMPPTMLQVVARVVLIIIMTLPLALGVIMSALSMWRDPRARAWHDVSTDSTAIQVAPWTTVRRSTPRTWDIKR